jgi:hypothetical protein
MKKRTKKLLAAAALSTGAVMTGACPLPLPGVSGFDVADVDGGTDAADGAADGAQSKDAAPDAGASMDAKDGRS